MLSSVVFFFFKQKTAYEIGTGDWSSDVALPIFDCRTNTDETLGVQSAGFISELTPARLGLWYSQISNRSEERRVGKECRSRWSPYH